ncbi:unnamed protein product [Trifolium pratense]|uniref:Uncharacterized protein n=1 Tax=Trifolium pratense TaxID=57577 RepID=A0ACB0IC90_TRIPR|nr:unnamed protein product [Trifolium pratense]
MNPNHHNPWSNFMQNGGFPPFIPNQQNTSYFENSSNNPNSLPNSNIQNPTFISNQNNSHFGNSPYHTPPYPYHYQNFSSQSTSPTMSHGVQMNNSHMQLSDQEPETPQFCTQDGLETINLGEEVGTTSVMKTSKTRFQPKEDELLIQSWLNISNDPIAPPNDSNNDFQEFLCRRHNIRDKQIHRHLQQDLIEHIWERFGHENNHN